MTLTAHLDRLQRRHLRIGWWGLALFLSLGVGLEALHGLKIGLYLDVGNETRRLLWTLGHAHGTLLSLVHLVFAATLGVARHAPRAHLASGFLTAATVLLPAGFLLGGAVLVGGDPGSGILLVPVGAVALFGAVLATALDVQGAET